MKTIGAMAASLLMLAAPAAHAQKPLSILDAQIIPASIDGTRLGLKMGYGSEWWQFYVIYFPTKVNSGESRAPAASTTTRTSAYMPAHGDRLGPADVLIDGVTGLEITKTLHQNPSATFSMRAGAAWLSLSECEQVVNQVILGSSCAKRGIKPGDFIGGDAVKTTFKLAPTVSFLYKNLSLSYNTYYGAGIGIQARW